MKDSENRKIVECIEVYVEQGIREIQNEELCKAVSSFTAVIEFVKSVEDSYRRMDSLNRTVNLITTQSNKKT